MPDAVTLDRLNTAPPDDLADVLRACNTSPAWAARLLGGRPYRDTDDAVAAAEQAVLDLDDAEVGAALAGHPRIGDGPSGAHAEERVLPPRAGARGRADAATRGPLATGNRGLRAAVRARVPVRAAGRDAGEMLAELERRLGNDPTTERAEATGQLAEITALRMRQVLAG